MATRAASSRPQNASSTTITSRGQGAEPEPGPAPQTPSRQSRRRKPGKGRAPPPAPQPKTNPESASQSSSDPELPMRTFERKLALNGARCIVGVDEVRIHFADDICIVLTPIVCGHMLCVSRLEMCRQLQAGRGPLAGPVIAAAVHVPLVRTRPLRIEAQSSSCLAA